MRAIMLSFTTAAALGLFISTASVQVASGQTDAGVTSGRVVEGQVRPMKVKFAKELVAAAEKASCSPPSGPCSGAFAVVDDAGVLVYLETIDGVLAGGPDLAIKKAETSALWRRPTQVFQEAVLNRTNISYADGTFSNMTTSVGGIPLVKGGRIVGGFGIADVGSQKALKQIADAVLAEAAKIFGSQEPLPPTGRNSGRN
jgi:uncharacterized protein GlcG (DUF336 family)